MRGFSKVFLPGFPGFSRLRGPGENPRKGGRGWGIRDLGWQSAGLLKVFDPKNPGNCGIFSEKPEAFGRVFVSPPGPRRFVIWAHRYAATPSPCGEGVAACQKSLAEFAPIGANKISIHFRPGRVPGRKYFSGCQCGSCAPMAHKECAQQTAKELSKSPAGDFRQSETPSPCGEGVGYTS